MNSCTQVKEQHGDVAQMVERSLCMREARGSIPRISIFYPHFDVFIISDQWKSINNTSELRSVRKFIHTVERTGMRLFFS